MHVRENKINIILVTGFLGSGKTTFLNRLIEFYKTERIALIINDFGKISVDGILLSQHKDFNGTSKIYEITNGSIFCSCLSAELVKALKFFAKKELKTVIIEASGLSDPSTFGKILSEHNLDKFYKMQNAVCLIDSTNVLKLFDKIVAIEKQIHTSNIILINKTDLVSQFSYDAIYETVKQHNPFAQIIRTSYSHYDLSLLKNSSLQKIRGIEYSCNTSTNRARSLLLEQKNISMLEINEFYFLNRNFILRLKGFYKINSQTYYVSDNNNELKFENIDSANISSFGLSVLLQKEYKDQVLNEWNSIKVSQVY